MIWEETSQVRRCILGLICLSLVFTIQGRRVSAGESPSRGLRNSSEETNQNDELVVVTSSPAEMRGTTQFDVRSAKGREYRIFVSVPTVEAPADGWPIIYCTDANDLFPVVQAAVWRLSRTEHNAVVVGIGYPTDDRDAFLEPHSRDLTTPAAEEWIAQHAVFLKGIRSGECEQFLAFIQSELKPWVNKLAKVDASQQCLVGHSFGGLFSLYVMLNQPEAFQSYVAISPSIWWADGEMLRLVKSNSTKLRELITKPRLYLAVGENEQTFEGIPAARAEILKQRQMVDNCKRLKERLNAEVPQLSIKLDIVEDADHGTVVLPAIMSGMKFALRKED